MDSSDGELFNPDADFDRWNRARPHWHQPAAICFLTLRLNDSIPVSVIQQWHRERLDFLHRHGVQVERDWKTGYQALSANEKRKFDRHFSRQRETTLDRCIGGCELAHPTASLVVANSLTKFHGDRYWLGDFVIMPNHVHCLIAFKTSEIAKTQPGLWMRYSARKINGLTGRAGALWYPEPFDHLIRSDEQLNYLRDYIRDNPKKAKVPEDAFLYRESGGQF